RLNWRAIDADDEVVRRAGKTIADIFADDGEPAFRELEEQVVADLCLKERAVVALGGGAILREATRRRLRAAGPVVWLTAPAEVLAERIAADTATAANRPRLTGLAGVEEVRTLLAQRTPLYEECATVSFDTAQHTADSVADRIHTWLQGSA
ncbi:MAG: shikimate kinase, partial [Planctomycetota bacterium]